MSNKVIAAIATAYSPSGIGIIRLSGKGCVEIADTIFVGKESLTKAKDRKLIYGHIIDNNEILDEVLVSIMRGPHSYTTEDIVEINCHGGILILKRVLGLLYENGASPAKPGEFTMRAFLNGRIDLSQAESVMDMISAENDISLKNSIQHLSGQYSNVISSLREDLLYEIAFIETALDDPEHFSLEDYPDKLEKKVNDIVDRLDQLIESSNDGIILKDGIPTALIGSVNVGKSSILNALTGMDKAIVTDIPGTTRDIIEEKIRLGEISLKIIDTAGIRKTQDPIETIGIDMSKKQMETASLVLYVIDMSKELEDQDKKLLDKLNSKKAIILLNKSDKNHVIDKKLITEYTSHPIIEISAKNLLGFDELKNKIIEMFLNNGIDDKKEVYVTNERHQYHLKQAKNSLMLVLDSIKQYMTEDIFSIDLTDAYVNLGKILGKEIEDDVVETIFSKFCIGK